MNERCPECGCQDTYYEYLDERNSGRAHLITQILHCRNCGSNPSKLIPAP